MILDRFTTYSPDGLGPYRPGDMSFEFGCGLDVTIRGQHRHSDGSLYNLAGCALQFTFKAHDTDVNPLVARGATITDDVNALYEFPVTPSDRLLLVPGRYVSDVIFFDPSGKRDEGLLPSRVNITRTIGQAGDPISVPTQQQPLALGPVGLVARGAWSALITYGLRDWVTYTVAGITSSWYALGTSTNVPPGSNPAIWTLLAQGAVGPSGPPVQTYASVAAFPDPTASVGQFAIAADEGMMYFAYADAWSPAFRVS